MVTTGPGLDETVVRLGELDGAPMSTITHHDVGSLAPAAPTAAYLRWIAVGLREAHGYDDARIARYLVAAPGVHDGVDRDRDRGAGCDRARGGLSGPGTARAVRGAVPLNGFAGATRTLGPCRCWKPSRESYAASSWRARAASTSPRSTGFPTG